jgi:outer membrane lipoprotein-sorting protein
MNRIKTTLFAVTTLFVSVIQAQTADEIINKHIEAIGGKEKLSQVKSVYIENSVEIMGNKAPVTEYLLNGKGYKNETEFNGTKIIQCYTDKGGWAVNPMAGSATAQPMPEDMYKVGKIAMYAGGALLDYAAKGGKTELLGQEDGAYKIKLTIDSAESFYFIDPATWYIKKASVKGEMMGQSIEVVTTFSDYKKTDFGIVMAYSKTVDLGAFSMPSIITKVEVNKEIDPAIFDMPK